MFIMISPSGDPATEDEHNTLRAWSCTDYAPNAQCYVYHHLPSTEVQLESVSTANVCLSNLKLALMGTTCLYSGVNTFIVNLLRQTEPKKRCKEVWEAQYGDGTGNAVYTKITNPVFVGQSFSIISYYLFREFSVNLFGLKKYCHSFSKPHIVLNPGKEYFIEKGDILIYLAQNHANINDITNLTQSEFDLSFEEPSMEEFSREEAHLTPRVHTSHEDFVFSQPQSNGIAVKTQFPSTKSTNTKIGKPKTFFLDDKVPLCHLLKIDSLSEDRRLSNADILENHILVCTGNYNLFIFICTLRAAHLDGDQLTPILLLCEEEPTHDEFSILSQFPKVYFQVGSPRKLKDLVEAGVYHCSKVVILNLSTHNSETRDEFNDSTAIMISHLIYNLFRNSESKKTCIISIEKRSNIKFVRPGVSRKSKRAVGPGEEHASDWSYHPMLASGQILAEGMLDTILFCSYKDSVILGVCKLLCGIRVEEDYQQDKALSIQHSTFTLIPLPISFENRPYSALYRWMASQGIIPMGIYRQADTDGVYHWGNRLPYVYSNPLPSVLLREHDLIYVLMRL